MSEVTVENLPEDVFVEVFKWLDSKSLKNVMLTCKEWSDYVRRSHRWTLILDGRVSLGDAEVLLESVLMANRKYNKVMVKGWTDMKGKILEIFEKHGAFIHELTISWNHSTNASFWCQILNTIPNLKTLMMDTSYAGSFSDVSDEELPPLHKLKTLELVDDSTAVLKIFKKCQIHTLNVNIFRINSDHQSRQVFWNFLATQQDLKELRLNSAGCSALFGTQATEKLIPFRLKKLSVSGPAFSMPTNSLNNLMEFMKLHKSTLEDLDHGDTFPTNFYKFVFSEFKRLKTLSLAVGDIPQTQLEINESVTSFQLRYYGWATGLAANTFVSRLPNVQKLMLYGPCDSLFDITYIADNMKQLRSLDIFSYKAKSFDGTRFPALKSLRIRRLYGPVNWFAFAKNNPGIKELWIGYADKPIYLDVTGLTRNLKLHKLTIECSELNCNEKFFEVIRKNCPELKSLELNKKSMKVDISTVADIPGLRFRKF